jgi:hypothetical protein
MEPTARTPRLVAAAGRAPDHDFLGAGELGRDYVDRIRVAAAAHETRMRQAVHTHSVINTH